MGAAKRVTNALEEGAPPAAQILHGVSGVSGSLRRPACGIGKTVHPLRTCFPRLPERLSHSLTFPCGLSHFPRCSVGGLPRLVQSIFTSFGKALGEIPQSLIQIVQHGQHLIQRRPEILRVQTERNDKRINFHASPSAAGRISGHPLIVMSNLYDFGHVQGILVAVPRLQFLERRQPLPRNQRRERTDILGFSVSGWGAGPSLTEADGPPVRKNRN